LGFPNCWLKPGTKANDYRCPGCGFWYQLKSKQSRIGILITDGAYGAMMDAIQNDRAPNFFFLHYEITGGDGRAAPSSSPSGASGDGSRRFPLRRNPARTSQRDVPTNETTWVVRNLLLVPHFAFPPSAIIKRPPLTATARRTGWVGCNFNLSRIPADARIEIVRTISPHPDPLPLGEGNRVPTLGKSEAQPFCQMTGKNSPSPWGEGRDEGGQFQTIITPPTEVREQFKRVKPLAEIGVKERGWTLDVLNLVHRLITEKRQRTGAVQNVSRSPGIIEPRASVLDCGGPPPLSIGEGNEFSNAEVYAFASELEKLHPGNRQYQKIKSASSFKSYATEVF
jgi:hypothetical protein